MAALSSAPPLGLTEALPGHRGSGYAFDAQTQDSSHLAASFAIHLEASAVRFKFPLSWGEIASDANTRRGDEDEEGTASDDDMTPGGSEQQSLEEMRKFQWDDDREETAYDG